MLMCTDAINVMATRKREKIMNTCDTVKFLLGNNSIRFYTNNIESLYIGSIEFYNDSEYMRFDAQVYAESLVIEEIANRARNFSEDAQSRGSQQTDQFLIGLYLQLNAHEFTQ